MMTCYLKKNQTGAPVQAPFSASTSTSSRATSITPRFWPTIKPFTFSGLLPLTFSRHSGNFEFKMYSISTLITIIVSIMTVAVNLYFYLTFFQGIRPWNAEARHGNMSQDGTLWDGESADSSTALQSHRRNLAIFAIGVVCNVRRVACAWLQATGIARFLKGQIELEGLIVRDEFSKHKEKLGQKARRNIVWEATIICAAAVALSLALRTYIASGEASDDCLTYVATLVMIIGGVYANHIAEPAADLMAVVMFQLVSSVLYSISEGIRHESNCCWAGIGAERVKLWRRLMLEVEDDCEKLCACLRLGQLAMIFECIVMSTICIFLLVIIPWDDEKALLPVLIWFVFILMYLIRLFFKAWAAERVEENGKKLMAAIMDAPIRPEDLAAQLQVKLTQSAFALRPIRIHWGALVFSRRIMLTVLNSLVTYLIVLLQFVPK